MRRRSVVGVLWAFLFIGALAGAATGAVVQANEEQIGRAAAQDMERRQGVYTDAAANARVQRLAQAMVHASGCHSNFQFRILNQNEPNGLALPGGYIFITKGLLRILPEDELLLAALGHEIGHIALGHMTEMLREQAEGRDQRPSVSPGQAQSPGQTPVRPGGTRAPETPSQAREKAADRAAARYLASANLDPRAVLRLLARLSRQPELNAAGSVTHPTWEDRVRSLELYLASPQFQADAYPSWVPFVRAQPRPAAPQPGR